MKTPVQTPAPAQPSAEAELQTARAVARGVCRLLGELGQASLTEFTLRTGRRVDVIGLAGDGLITVVEIKSSLADFRADQKWPDYLEFCDRFYFAVPAAFPREVLPVDQGLMVADAYGAEILRPSAELATLAGARRRSVILRFAQTAAGRLQGLTDPGFGAG
ncbi:MAG: MmcB family DNA repair protein [Kiloniellales bacterium]|nr:MmcB family DNA repair protein [Kiloniellales bacterium]